MLNFEGQGYIYKDSRRINKTRDEIIKSGWNNNANIPKVNEILRRFHTNELTSSEMLEYIIKNTESDMTLSSPVPKLSDFGVSEQAVDKINNTEKLLFIIGVIFCFGGATLFYKLFGYSFLIYTIHKLIVGIYIAICVLYLRNDKEYITNRKMFKNYKKVYAIYYNRLKEIEQIEKEKERKRIENEKKRQEELRRQEEKRRREEELRKQRELREHREY